LWHDYPVKRKLNSALKKQTGEIKNLEECGGGRWFFSDLAAKLGIFPGFTQKLA
jgi:hypothetical protein